MYEEFKSNQEIENICAEYGIRNYTINPDGSVDLQGDINLSRYEMAKLPLEFGKVGGEFDCFGVGLTTLEGCPKEVGWDIKSLVDRLKKKYKSWLKINI